MSATLNPMPAADLAKASLARQTKPVGLVVRTWL